MLASAAFAVVLVAFPASAQIAGTVSAETDYQFLGVSLTQRRPAASLDLSYELLKGAYAGASLIEAENRSGDIRFLGHIEYLGYAFRLDQTRSIDVGVADSELTSYAGLSDRRIHYTDVHAAIDSEHLHASVQYIPNYIAPHAQAFYFDLGASARPAPDWRLFAHIGYFDPIVPQTGPAPFHPRYDWQAGVSRAFGVADVRLAWTSRSGSVGAGQSRGALVAGADVYF